MKVAAEWAAVIAAIAALSWAIIFIVPALGGDGRCTGAGLIKNGAAWCDDQAAQARSRERAERHQAECVSAYDRGDLVWVARNCD